MVLKCCSVDPLLQNHWRTLVKCIDALASFWLVELKSPGWQGREESQESIILIIPRLFWCTDSSWNHCTQLQVLIVYISDIYDVIHKTLNYIPLNLYPTLTRGEMKGRLLFNSHQNNFLFFPQFWQHVIPYVSFLFLWTLLYLHIIILSKTDIFLLDILTGSSCNFKNVIWERETSR